MRVGEESLQLCKVFSWESGKFIVPVLNKRKKNRKTKEKAEKQKQKQKKKKSKNRKSGSHVCMFACDVYKAVL